MQGTLQRPTPRAADAGGTARERTPERAPAAASAVPARAAGATFTPLDHARQALLEAQALLDAVASALRAAQG